MDVPSEIEALLRRRGITQAALAKEAGVSQPTISRARKRVPERRSEEYGRLCDYIHEQLDEITLPGAACNALAEIWDGSSAHDESLAALIRAADGLSRGGN